MVEGCLRGLADVDAVVDDDFGALGQGVDFDAAGDHIHCLRGLHEVLGARAGFACFEGEVVGLFLLLLARGLLLRFGARGEELAELLGEVGRVLGAAVELAQVGVLFGQVGRVLLCLDRLDEFGGHADAGVVGWDGGVAAWHADDDVDVCVAFLAHTGFGEGLAPDFLEGRALVDGDGDAVGSVAFEEERRQVAGALTAGDLFVEAEGDDDAALGLVAGVEQELDGFHDGDELVLAVRGTAAPDVRAVVDALERWVSPGVDGGVGHRHNILVGHEEGGLQVLVGALPCVDQAVGVDFLGLEILVNPGEGVLEVVCEVVHDVPSFVFANGSHVIEALSWDSDSSRQTDDGAIPERLRGDMIVGTVDLVVIAREKRCWLRTFWGL